MEQQNPEFEVPEVTKQITKPELDLLLPPDESAVIYSGLQKIFHDEAKDVVVKMRPRRTPAKRQPKSR